jgi:hypothetical protein
MPAMFRLLLTSCFIVLTLCGKAQVTVFSEDFENPPGNVTSTGSPGWFINSRLYTSFTNSDSATIDAPGSISYLTTNSFSTAGLFYVTLTFNNICKLEFFDGGTLEYSVDGGITWNQLIDTDGNPGGFNNCNYLGTGLFRTQSSKFQEASYGVWMPGNPSSPQQSWWQTEIFDISQVAGNQSNVQLRFKVADGNNNGGAGRAGWFIDDIEVVAAPCELINPVFTQNAPFYPPTVYNLGPFIHNYTVTDLSGLNSVTLYYTINGIAQTPITLTNTGGNDYSGSIPAVNDGDIICYYVEAIDASGCNNTAYHPGPTASNTICFTANQGVTFPYCDNFDLPGIPWTGSGSGGTVWQQGTPAFGVTTGAFSPPTAWDINLNSAYGNNANAALVSPEFSFTVGAGAKLEFWQNRSVEQTWDGTRLEWATNINGPWTLLGSVGCATCVNWYNSAAITSSGQPGWTGNSNGWIKSEIELDAQFNNLPQVWFRFVFTSDGSVTGDGMSIDNFCITLPQPDDIGAIAITQPGSAATAGACVDVVVQVKNFGINPQSNFPVSYIFNPGGITGTATFTGTLNPGATASITLPCVTVPTGAFNICAWTGLIADTNPLNDTICGNGTGVPTIPVSFSQQYFDDFNGPNAGWTANPSAGATVWQLGAPTFGVTNSAYSPPSCWDVNLTTPYGNNANCELVSPFFDFSNAVDPELSFWRNNRCESSWDGTRLEYSLNGGPWTLLGAANLAAPCWISWYNSNPNINSSGMPAWMGQSTGWTKTEAKCLSFLNNASTVRFRFVFTSDGSVTQDGFSIDDFRIHIPIPLSASPVTVTTNAVNNNFIIPGQPVQFTSPISNPGTTPLTSVHATLTVNGVPIVTDTIFYSPALPSQQNLPHTFSQLWNAAPGVYQVCVITSNPNNALDQNPFDDTTCITISVFDTVTVTTQNPYCNDFESGPQWISLNPVTYSLTTNSWQLGTPAQTFINQAHSGSNAWMTKLNANYPSRDTSGLFSPVFNVEPNRCYKLSFWTTYDTDPYVDGGIVEYSTDFAQTWGHLGFHSWTNPNWYNAPFVTALGGSPGLPGFSAQQVAWKYVEQEINFWNPGNVIFRFRFASDNTVNFEGWAVDDFCFEEITAPCTVGLTESTSETTWLSQNEPNPTSGLTSVNYYLTEQNHVHLYITDVTGRLIRQLVDESREKGQHRQEINISGMAQGIYYLTLEAGTVKLTRKIVVTR